MLGHGPVPVLIGAWFSSSITLGHGPVPVLCWGGIVRFQCYVGGMVQFQCYVGAWFSSSVM